MNGNSGYLTSTNQAYNIKRARRKLSTKSEVDCLDGMAIKGHKMSIAEIAALKKLPAGYSVILSAPANGLTITHVMNFALDKY